MNEQEYWITRTGNIVPVNPKEMMTYVRHNPRKSFNLVIIRGNEMMLFNVKFLHGIFTYNAFRTKRTILDKLIHMSQELE